MTRSLLYQLDGKLPNLALMRLSTHLKAQGKQVIFRRGGKPERQLWELDRQPDEIYASCIFTATRPVAERLKVVYPQALIGGTGWSVESDLQQIGVSEDTPPDYSLYPDYPHSLGFTQRGCRLKCKFCVVPRKEGAIREATGVMGIWRGEPWPKHLALLDNDFFGSPQWQSKIRAIQSGKFKVSFNQGINARMITDEAAEAIASIDYRDDDFKTKRIYTAWDNRKDEQRLFDGLRRLVKYGVKPDHIMVYVLIGYWPGETTEDRIYRVQKLLDFGARPFPMAYTKTSELLGIQRWAIGAYAKRVSWEQWARANYRPEKLGSRIPSSQAELFPIVGQAA
jgi:hypothetical protein